MRTAEGKGHLFVAIDRTTKIVHAELYAQATRQTAVNFLRSTLQSLPYRVHKVLTDNGIQFTKKPGTEAFHYTSLEEFRLHLKDYLWAYNSARPLRALKGRTPIGFILEQWHKDPQHFKGDPGHYFTGPNT